MILRKLVKSLYSSPKAGYTLLESLVALIVVTILMSAITPLLAFSAATRVQSRRADLASQAARTYLDGVRSGSIQNPTISSSKNPGAPTTGGSLSCNSATAETDPSRCTTPSPPTGSILHCVDGNGDGTCTTDTFEDMVVQAWGYNPKSTNPDKGYQLGIRVYRASVFSESSTELGTEVSSTLAEGLGNPEAPLVALRREITNENTGYQDLRNRIECEQDSSSC
jgi:prepilin-type N-terminal cleavage/methylation domain-containing protein